MDTLLTVIASRPLVAAGWTLIVVLFETLALAVLYGIWRLMQPRASASRQYTVGMAAFCAAVLLAAATPVAIQWMPVPAPQTASVQSPAALPVVSVLQGVAALNRQPATPPRPKRTLGLSPDDAAGTAGLVWGVGMMLLALRLLGGAILALWIRKRAVPVTDAVTVATAERLSEELGLRDRVTLLQSAHVEAPVVIGWRRSTIILPSGVMARVAPDTMAPLFAHEFAHIRRRDYLANFLQSIAELPLFFSPAVLWMSRRIREAREYCCDDMAVRRCGDARSYVDALVTLASLAAVTTVRPAVGSAGPRLVTRVSRLLQRESIPKLTQMRIVGLAMALVLLTISGWRVAAISAARMPRTIAAQERADLDPQTRLRAPRIPYGYGARDDSGVELDRLHHTDAEPQPSVTVRNVTNEPITALRLVAVIYRFPMSRPLQIVTSDPIPVDLPPHKSVDLAKVSFPREFLEAANSGERLQMFFGVQEVRFANAPVWSIIPNTAARDHNEALAMPRAQLTREFLTRHAAQPVASVQLCRDQNDKAYSLGAVVGIRDEPGSRARCNAGRWEDYAGR